jgi:von Willebrand factor type A domain
LRRSLVAIVASALLVPAAAAQGGSCFSRSVPVSISTNQGQSVASLGPADFKASLYHKQIKVLSIAVDDGPRRVLLVLDASGSMTRNRAEWNSLLDVAVQVLNSMRDRDQAALLVFGSKVDQTLPFTNDRTTLLRAIADFRDPGRYDPKERRQTALWDALNDGMALFGEPRDGDAVYVISDGDDNDSKSRPAVLEPFAARFRFFALIPGSEYDWAKIPTIPITPDFLPASQSLEKLVERSGGTWVIRPSEYPRSHSSEFSYRQNSDETTERWKLLKAFPDRMRGQIASVFANQRLEIELPQAIATRIEWNLSLKGSASRKGLSIAYPRELQPCSSDHN